MQQVYKVYFEIYGKKMMAKVKAKDMFDAQNKVEKKIIFHKVEKAVDLNDNPIMDFFNNLKQK